MFSQVAMLIDQRAARTEVLRSRELRALSAHGAHQRGTAVPDEWNTELRFLQPSEARAREAELSNCHSSSNSEVAEQRLSIAASRLTRSC